MPAILRDTDEGAHTSNYITTTRKSAEYVTNVALVLESLKRIKKRQFLENDRERRIKTTPETRNLTQNKGKLFRENASRSDTSEKIGFNFRDTRP
jgi:hypothetical protein